MIFTIIGTAKDYIHIAQSQIPTILLEHQH